MVKYAYTDTIPSVKKAIKRWEERCIEHDKEGEFEAICKVESWIECGHHDLLSMYSRLEHFIENHGYICTCGTRLKNKKGLKQHKKTMKHINAMCVQHAKNNI
jgi:hypothetical protein